MTREEAIKILKAIRVYECYPKSASEETKEAIDMAMEALSAPQTDLISRELAMERIANDNVVGGMERINEYNNSTEFNEYLDGISDAITTIFCDVPSAEYEWIESRYVCTCSRCGYLVELKTPFCPNCGVKMKGEFK